MLHPRYPEYITGYGKGGKHVMRWKCCASCHGQHRHPLLARIHAAWLRLFSNY